MYVYEYFKYNLDIKINKQAFWSKLWVLSAKEWMVKDVSYVCITWYFLYKDYGIYLLKLLVGLCAWKRTNTK